MFHLNDLDVVDDEDLDLDDGLEFTRVPTPFEQIEQRRRQQSPRLLVLTRCGTCGGSYDQRNNTLGCETCHGLGFIDVPTSEEAFHRTKRGSDERVAVMAARYQAGLEIFPAA